ncbi:MAG: hypothetical protein EPO52_03780 [Herbiconiux sp.]|uniref:hypothetical protein n=1 Tax=Herbiconiux sp. TaxID=1871186 RepID=UPI00121492A2|nr:hypothetical protein [Herbiconiux sp.]TAJ49404.1 MAG: hypothetical protein EPO52_03780 [Herbiconiux sp.]
MSTGNRTVITATSGLRWRLADEGFWVGAAGGVFAGTIDQNGTHFYARNQFGEYIGDFVDFEHAQVALESRLPEIAAVSALRVA